MLIIAGQGMTDSIGIHGLGFLLIDSARWLRLAFERRIAEAGLGITAGEARTILNLHAMQACRQMDLAQRMGVEPMTVCSFLDRLQNLGFIERQTDPTDRRAKRVTLTERSQPLIAALEEELDHLLTQATQGLDAQETSALKRALQMVITNLQGELANSVDEAKSA